MGPIIEHLVFSCEHGGNRVPPPYAHCFTGARSALESHRGYDIGALALARALARRLNAPLHAATTTRLLVELNRSLHHPRLFSRWARAGLDAEERAQAIARHYRPHRERIRAAVAQVVARGRSVLHVGVHSFTPVLRGEVRRADIAFLYDPRRRQERAVAIEWQRVLGDIAPSLRIRRNYPYRGRDDGLTSWLRQEFPISRYWGLELEVNQRHLRPGAKRRAFVTAAVIESLGYLTQPPSPAT